jgi:DNA-damage-inducible protein J
MQLKYKKECEMNKRSSVVQISIDPSIKDEATKVFSQMGLSVSDVMRIVLSRTATEGRVPVEMIADQASYDAWFKSKVMETLEEKHNIDHHDVKSSFHAKRQSLLNKS